METKKPKLKTQDRTTVSAMAKSVRISPRKVRLVADSIRNMSVNQAMDVISLVRKRPTSAVYKVLKSATANALHNAKVEQDSLFIKSIEVSEGPVFKRFHPSTRGRVHPYKKRSSNIRIILEDKNNGTKS